MSRRNRSTLVFEDSDDSEKSRPSRHSVEKGKSSAITGVMRISLTKIYDAIHQLSQVSNKKLENLSELESALMSSVMDAVRDRNSNSNHIMSKISQEFAGKIPLLPGTVGAQLAGCVHNDSFVIPECSAVCAGSALPDTVGMSECMYNVIHYRADGSIVLYHKNPASDHAILHVLSDNFKGVTQEQLKSIEEDGIKYVNINKPGSEFDISSGFLPLSKVPVLGFLAVPPIASSSSSSSAAPVASSSAAAPQAASTGNSQKHHPHPPPPTPVYPFTWNAFTVAGIILLIILAILLLWFIFANVNRNRRASNAKETEVVAVEVMQLSPSRVGFAGRSSVAEAML